MVVCLGVVVHLQWWCVGLSQATQKCVLCRLGERSLLFENLGLTDIGLTLQARQQLLPFLAEVRGLLQRTLSGLQLLEDQLDTDHLLVDLSGRRR